MILNVVFALYFRLKFCVYSILGGTSGIGEAFAEEFASRGMNIMLIGRSNDRMINITK